MLGLGFRGDPNPHLGLSCMSNLSLRAYMLAGHTIDAVAVLESQDVVLVAYSPVR